MNEKLLRMAADILLPVGERAEMITSMLEGVEAAKNTRDSIQSLSDKIDNLSERLNSLILLNINNTLSSDKVAVINTSSSDKVAVMNIDDIMAIDDYDETNEDENDNTVNLNEGFEDARENKG